MLPTTANCLLSFICSANTVTLWKRWGCMWLHMWGNHQNSFLCLSSMSSPSSSSSVPTESRKGSAKSKGRRGAQCLKAVANPLPTESSSLYCMTHPKVGAVCTCWDKGVSGAYLCGRISLRSPGWRWNLGLKFSAYSGCSIKPVWIKGKRNVHIHIFFSVTCLCSPSAHLSWRGMTDGA